MRMYTGVYILLLGQRQCRHLVSRMAHDLLRLIQNLSCKSACHSKVCNDDTILGVFTPCLKELPVLHCEDTLMG